MPSFRSHSLRFYSVEPQAVTCLSHSPSLPLLAVARADSSVEVWNTQHCLVLQASLPPPPASRGQASVESLAWGGDTLYSCGLHGQVVQYDLARLCEARRHAVTSGPAWCLAIDTGATKMAVGTEEGFVCLFSITKEGLDYSRVLDRQEGRILCLAWHSDGVHIATGSTDTVRVWNTSSGHPIARMTTGRAERSRETIVWCVAITDDMTVISGDSRGKTSFWNGRNGTLVDSVQSHKADVLTIALSPNQTTAYSSGVDPTLMHFQIIVKADGRRKWVKSLHRVISSHDVRSVVCSGDRVYSGGVDTYLTHSSYPARSVTKVPCLPSPAQCVGVASKARSVLLTYPTRLEVWQLGSTQYSSGGIGAVLPLEKEPVKQVEVAVKEGEQIVCSAISSSASYLAYSTNCRVRVLALSQGESGARPSLARVKLEVEGLAHHLAFYTCEEGGGEDRLMFCHAEGGVSSFCLGKEAEVVHTVSSQDLGLQGAVTRLSVGDRLAVLADRLDNIVAVDLASLTLQAKLPSYREAPLCALSISPSSATCLLVYSNQRVMEVCLSSARYTPFSAQLASKLPRAWLGRRTAVTQVTHVRGEEVIMLHDDSMLAVIDKEKDLPEPNSKLFFSDPRATPDESQSESSYAGSHSPSSMKEQVDGSTSGLRMSRKFCHLLSFNHLQGDEVVALEVKPSTIEEQLPPSLKQKKFGGS